MKYYRIIFRKNEEDGNPEWTDVVEGDMTDEDFQQMNWEKPIIRQFTDGHAHYISLDEHYLNAMVLGIHTYKDLETMAVRASDAPTTEN